MEPYAIFSLFVVLGISNAVGYGIAGDVSAGTAPTERLPAVIISIGPTKKPSLSKDNLSLDILSEAAGGEGFYALILLPAHARFGEDGAPIIVHMHGGWNA